jgi:hypothetical protein
VPRRHWGAAMGSEGRRHAMTKLDMLTDVTVWLSAIGGGVVAFHQSSGLGIVVGAVAASVGIAFGFAFGAALVNAVEGLWVKYAGRWKGHRYSCGLQPISHSVLSAPQHPVGDVIHQSASCAPASPHSSSAPSRGRN